VRSNGLVGALAKNSSWPDCVDSLIQNPLAVIVAPPVLVIDDLSKADEFLCAAFAVSVNVGVDNVGALTISGDPCILAIEPAPAEFTALTLKL